MRALSLVPVAWLLAAFLARAQVSPTIVTTIPVLRLDARPILHWKGGTGVLAITFADSLRLESTTLRSRGLRDVAIVCLNADGSIRWTNHIGGPADDAAADVHVGTNFITCLLAAGGSTGAPSTLRVNNVTLATNGEYDVGLVGYTLAGRLEWFRVDGGPFPDVPTSMVVDEEQGIAVAATYVRRTRFETKVLADTMGETSCALIQYTTRGGLEAASSTTAQSFGSAAATTTSMWTSGQELHMLITTLGDIRWHSASMSSESPLPTVVGHQWSADAVRTIASPSDCAPSSLVCAPLGNAVVAASFESLPCEADVLPSLALRRHEGSDSEIIQAYHSSTGSATIYRAAASPSDVVVVGSFRGRLSAADGAVLDAGDETNLAGFLVSTRGLTSVVRGESAAEFTSAVFDGQHLYACAEVHGRGTVDGLPVGVASSSSIVILRYDVAPTSVRQDNEVPSERSIDDGPWILWNMQGQVVATGSGSRLPEGLSAGVYAIGAPFKQARLLLMP